MVCHVEDCQDMLELNCRPLAFISYKTFLKNKRSGASFSASFSAWFFGEKYIFCYILLPDQISLSGCLYFMRYCAICVMYLKGTNFRGYLFSRAKKNCISRVLIFANSKKKRLFTTRNKQKKRYPVSQSLGKSTRF